MDSIITARDKGIRRKILVVLQGASIGPTGFLRGSTLYSVVADTSGADDGPRDEDHLLLLCRQLVRKGFVVEQALPRLRRQMFSLEFTSFAITSKGDSLLNGTAPIDPDIEDDREVA